MSNVVKMDTVLWWEDVTTVIKKNIMDNYDRLRTVFTIRIFFSVMNVSVMY